MKTLLASRALWRRLLINFPISKKLCLVRLIWAHLLIQSSWEAHERRGAADGGVIIMACGSLSCWISY